MILEPIRPFLNILLRRDLQRNITREYKRAFRECGHAFPERVGLPSPCGRSLPERVVELLLARLSYQAGRKVLDVGHANSMACHRDMLRSLPMPRDITGIDVAEPVFDPLKFYNASVRASICATPFADGAFDLIWCISSFEHFGMDNSGYSPGFVADETMPERALREMLRVLRVGGGLLITVPYGRYEDHGWFRNFDQSLLQHFLEPLRSRASIQELYFAHTRHGGWSSADPNQLRAVGYLDQRNAGAAALAAVFIEKQPGRDR